MIRITLTDTTTGETEIRELDESILNRETTVTVDGSKLNPADVPVALAALEAAAELYAKMGC